MNLSDMAGIWLMNAPELRLLAGGQQLSAVGNGYGRGPAQVRSGVAVVPITGALSKSPAWWSSGSSSIEIGNSILAAANDPAVNAILLHVDSPGGTAQGTAELADTVTAARRVKPVWAYAQDLTASAAYWVASQADRLFANRMALIGSIGTYSVVVDSSGMANKLGLQVHVIASGELKGAAAPGAPVSADFLGHMREIVQHLNSHFLAGVGAGRHMTPNQVQSLADGRLFPADQAVKLGLADGVAPFEKVFQSLASGQFLQPAPAARSLLLAGNPTNPEMTMGDPAIAAEIQKLQADNQNLQAQVQARGHGVPTAKPAAAVPPKSQQQTTDEIQAFDDLVQAAMSRGLDRVAAVSQVSKKHPKAHLAYLAAANEKTGRHGVAATLRAQMARLG